MIGLKKISKRFIGFENFCASLTNQHMKELKMFERKYGFDFKKFGL